MTRIKLERLRRNMRQIEFAAALGINQATLSHLENGLVAKCPPTIEKKLKDFFGESESFESLQRKVTL